MQCVRFSPGPLAEHPLRLGVVHQDLIQVLLVQNEEVGKAMSDHVGRAPVPPAHRQQTAKYRDLRPERPKSIKCLLDSC